MSGWDQAVGQFQLGTEFWRATGSRELALLARSSSGQDVAGSAEEVS